MQKHLVFAHFSDITGQLPAMWTGLQRENLTAFPARRHNVINSDRKSVV
jgi:hypothetical protein